MLSMTGLFRINAPKILPYTSLMVHKVLSFHLRHRWTVSLPRAEFQNGAWRGRR